MSTPHVLHLFDAFGVELEYMIVAADSLSVLPVTDRVLHSVAGEYLSEVELGEISWSNELALHVIELKTTRPTADLAGLPQLFQEHIERINELLRPLGGRLMPSAMHPWMNPLREMKLWPHEFSPIYEAFNRIFDCRGHGWANLQSVHLNLPFSGDAEFAHLHAAVRLLLPILPALAASSPIYDGRLTGLCDSRLEVYRHNARRIPAVVGQVIPEPVYSRAEYERQILRRMYDEIAPYDPEGVLQHEFLNARGAIARFDRGSIEIRVLDVQECPAADLAICIAAVAVLKALTAERWTSLETQQACDTERLHNILLAAIQQGEHARIDDDNYLAQFGFSPGTACTAGELWRHLAESCGLLNAQIPTPWQQALQTILDEGTLSCRITNAVGPEASQQALYATYGKLCDCLAQGSMFGSLPAGD
jgi:glutamate---cysteine ligase / carboxylate-amine ligase